MPDNINTHEYWEQRFEENWELRGGREQTAYFAELAAELMPEWLKRELAKSSYSFCDAGCGMGDSYATFVKLFPGLRYHGFDISQTAVDSANSHYPGATFRVNDVFNLDTSQTFDVVFCSNVLEHFEQPEQIAQNLLKIARKYLIIMVPFREASEEPEHVVRFTPHNIPLVLGNSCLVYASGVQCEERWRYDGRQALLIYALDGHREPVHYLSDVIEHISNDRLETMDDKLKRADNDISMNKKRLEELNEELNNEFYQYKQETLKLQHKHECLQGQMREQQQQHERKIEQVREQLRNECTALQIKYDELYMYSAGRDEELHRINNSWSLRIGYVLLQPFRLLRRVMLKLGRMAKYLLAWDMAGMKFELAEPFARRARPVITRIKKKKVLEGVANDIKGKTVLILPPTLDWEMKLYQRPQQLANAYSRRADMVVVYLTPNLNESILTGIKAEDRLWVLNWELYDDLLPYLEGAARRILSISWTVNKSYSDKLPDARLIYEYIDELEIFMSYGEQMEVDHAVLAQRADVTVCTATKLYEQVKGIAKNPILCTNGGDYDLFKTTGGTPPHPGMAALKQKYHKVLGYYGALAKWFDYATLQQVAEQRPEWGWALIGLDYDETLKQSGILQLPNVEYLGPQEYRTLPQFLTAFDIATIPFAINEITLSTSPVKLFEYMAGGKPILTSDLPECRKYESVLRYTSADEFITQAEKLFALQPDDEYWNILEREAKANTWDAKVAEILSNV